MHGRHCTTKERLNVSHLQSWNPIETGFCCGHRDKARFGAPKRGRMLLETCPGKVTPLRGTDMSTGSEASEGQSEGE